MLGAERGAQRKKGTRNWKFRCRQVPSINALGEGAFRAMFAGGGNTLGFDSAARELDVRGEREI